MNFKSKVSSFEVQIKAVRDLVDLARTVCSFNKHIPLIGSTLGVRISPQSIRCSLHHIFTHMHEESEENILTHQSQLGSQSSDKLQTQDRSGIIYRSCRP